MCDKGPPDPAATAPRIFWGELTILGFGESHWRFFQHNAYTRPPTNLVCGDPIADASQSAGDRLSLITASDALLALQASVGSACCEPCTCDVSDSADVTATDALAILRMAIGTGPPLSCSVCN